MLAGFFFAGPLNQRYHLLDAKGTMLQIGKRLHSKSHRVVALVGSSASLTTRDLVAANYFFILFFQSKKVPNKICPLLTLHSEQHTSQKRGL